MTLSAFLVPAALQAVRHRTSAPSTHWSSTRTGTPARPLPHRRRASYVVGSRPVQCVAASRETGTGVGRSEQLQQFLDWFRGDFDNCFQVVEDRAAGLGWRAHEHVHCRLTPIADDEHPALAGAGGGAVVFAKYYYNGRPDIVYRQRMYRVVDKDDGSGDLEMQIYKMKFIHGLRVTRANLDFSTLDLGQLEDTQLYEFLPGSEVYWKFESGEYAGTQLVENGKHFTSYMREGGWMSPEGLRIEDDLVLTKEDLWVAEKVYSKDGTMVAGNRDGIPHKMQRVRLDSELHWTLDPDIAYIHV